MPDIPISHKLVARLQRHAEPLVDSYETVITRMVDAYENGGAPSAAAQPAASERQINPRDLPRLTHTKLLDATIDGAPVAKPNWNGLLDDMVRRSMKQVQDFDKLRQICPVNMIKGEKTDEGYNHFADINVSVQGQDANGACRGIVTAAQALGISVDVGFMWRHKDGAAHPGERARLRIPAGAGQRAA